MPFVFIFFFNFQKTTLISSAPLDQLGSRTESTGDLWGLEWTIKSQGTWQGAADWASTSCMPSWILSVLLRLSNCFPNTLVCQFFQRAHLGLVARSHRAIIRDLVWPLWCLSSVSSFIAHKGFLHNIKALPPASYAACWHPNSFSSVRTSQNAPDLIEKDDDQASETTRWANALLPGLTTWVPTPTLHTV